MVLRVKVSAGSEQASDRQLEARGTELTLVETKGREFLELMRLAALSQCTCDRPIDFGVAPACIFPGESSRVAYTCHREPVFHALQIGLIAAEPGY